MGRICKNDRKDIQQRNKKVFSVVEVKEQCLKQQKRNLPLKLFFDMLNISLTQTTEESQF